jgi:hypothetical protein
MKKEQQDYPDRLPGVADNFIIIDLLITDLPILDVLKLVLLQLLTVALVLMPKLVLVLAPMLTIVSQSIVPFLHHLPSINLKQSHL